MEVIQQGQVSPGQWKIALSHNVTDARRAIANGEAGDSIFKSRATLFSTFDSRNNGNPEANGLFPVPIPSQGTDPFKAYQDRCNFALKLYYWDPVVGTCEDLIIDLISAGVRLSLSGDEATMRFAAKPKARRFADWVDKMGLEDLIRWTIHDYVMFGRAAVLRFGDLLGPDRQYTLYNPQHMAVLDSFATDQNGRRCVRVGIPIDSLQPQNTSYMSQTQKDAFVNNLPEGFKSEQVDRTEYITIEPGRVRFVDRDKQPYERYPMPMAMRAAFVYRLKRLLQLADEATAEDIVNCIVLVTVGNDKYPAGPPDIEAIKGSFETNKRALTVYWNHTLRVEILRPPAGEILGSDKYDFADRAIYAAMGVPQFLIDAGGGGGGGYSNQWVQAQMMLMRLEKARRVIGGFWEGELNAIAPLFGLKNRVRLLFDPVDLRPQDRFKTTYLGTRGQGLSSGQSVLDAGGLDPATEVARLREEVELQAEGIFFPYANMSNAPGRPAGGPGNYPPSRDPSGTDPAPQQ